MNPAIRASVESIPSEFHWLFAELPPIVLRLRRAALIGLGGRFDAGLKTRGERALALALGEELSRIRQQRNALAERRVVFVDAANGAPDAAALRTVLVREIDATRSGGDRRGDLRALRRWLDADALLERIDASVDRVIIDARLVLRLMKGLPLRGAPFASVVEFMEEVDRPTRRLAITTMAEWLATIRQHGQDVDGVDTAVPERVEARLLSLIEHPSPEPLASRRVLPLLAAQPDGVERMAMRMRRGTSAHKDFLVRAAVGVRMVEMGHAEEAVDAVSVDPSELVRCRFVQALLASDRPDWHQLARDLGADDSAASVRAVLTLGDIAPVLDGAALEVGDLGPNEVRDLRLRSGETARQLATALLPLARTGRGFALETLSDNRVRVTRGTRRVPRLWRLVDALRHPDPGRRQGGDHLSGLHWSGNLRVPSRRMAEVSPTGVPGRAVLVPQWNGWAPWLPMLDDLVDALKQGELTLVTEEGVTTLTPPTERAARQRARAAITGNPRTLDRLRRAALTANDVAGRSAYVERLHELGYRVSFESVGHYPLALLDVVPEVAPPMMLENAAFIGPLFAAPLLAELWAQVYASSDSSELFAVTLGITGVFLGRLAYSNYKVRNAREQVPLVIGGWGTRGKSGVERLKAALFEGLGVEVTCKTTGCEAMLVHSPPGRPAVELFLYRPYDRASIWEHASTLRTAAALKSPVFLWECMALKPHYVEILQRHWTRDDLSTITNTYPDHEDVHGPTGEDVATVISHFMPDAALALTTETEMTPVLRDRAKERGTELIEISSDSVDRMPRDLLELFPHQEHPANVTLVSAMAEELGLDPEEAVVLMSEYVIPDLGSLATFPPVRHRGRILQYSNGSSANERTGFLNNWRRCGFGDHLLADVGTQLVTVVNNRFDRVARSQVFAEILVRDARAHRHVLIGSNLEGLRGYMAEALDGWVDELDLLGGGAVSLAKRWAALTDHMLIVDPGRMLRTLTARLDVARSGHLLADSVDELMESMPKRLLSLEDALQLAESLRGVMRKLVDEAVTKDGSAPPPLRGSRAGTNVLFPDPADRISGLADSVNHWMQTVAVALAWRSAAIALQVQGRAVEPAVHALVREVFWTKVVTVDDSHASGDVVIDRIAHSCPAGTVVRAMSVQNIKGTGLDFVYRWVYGRPILEDTALLGQVEATRQRQILDAMESHREWSVPVAREALSTLRTLPKDPFVDRAIVSVQAVLDSREALLETGPKRVRSRWYDRPAKLGRALWDPMDAIMRRRLADQLFTDLADHRISHARCAYELRQLSERGK